MINIKSLLLSVLGTALLASSSQAVQLTDIRVKSDAAVRSHELLSRLDSYRGREIDFTLLQKLLNDITAFYRAKGYLAAQAFFPQQRSTDGSLDVVVKTASLNEISISDLSHSNASTISMLFSRTKLLQGKKINSVDLNSELLKVKDLGVYDIAGYFEHNDNTPDGYADLHLDVKPKKTPAFEIFYDNYGNKSSGRNRIAALLSARNISGNADTASLTALATDKKQYSFSLGYDLPISSRLSVLNASLSYGTYDLKDEYEELGAKGTALTVSAGITHPLYRSPSDRVNLISSAYYKRMADKLLTYSLNFKKQSYGLKGGFMAENSLYDFNFKSSVEFNLGKLNNLDDYNIYEDRTFLIANAQNTSTYRISDNLYLKNTIQGQFSNRPLDASDRFTPGGVYGVSAFESNVASSDNGIFDDLRFGSNFSCSADFNVYTSFMNAYARNRNGSHASFSAIALGADISMNGFFVNTSVSKALGNNRQYAKDNLRVLVKLGYVMA